MNLETSLTDDVLVVHVRETRIDAACAIAFKEAMHTQISGQDRRVMLDLGDVTFLDSSGLGAVVAVRKMLGPDRALELARLSPPVERVLRLTRMDSIFPIHADLPDLHSSAV